MVKTKTLHRLLLLLIVLISGTIQVHAVFKERDFGKTIEVLCAELEMKYKQQQITMKQLETRAQTQHEQLVTTMQQIDQISLILYSQSGDFTFDMAYACQQATDLYNNSKITRLPFSKIMSRLDSEIERYDSLMNVLKRISPAIDNEENSSISEVADSIIHAQQSAEGTINHQQINAVNDPKLSDDKIALYVLNDKEIEIRKKCLFYAIALRNNTIKMKEKMSYDKQYYDEVSEKLTALNNYALKQYEKLQNNIFKNGGNNYFKVLASLGHNFNQINSELKEKYNELNNNHKGHIKSQWRGPVILITSVFILFYIFIATILSVVILRWCLPKKIRQNSNYKRCRGVIGVTCGVFLFSLFITIAHSFMHHNFIVMAIGITLDYSWLLLVILISLLIRLNSKQINAGVMVYTPFMLMAFVVIVFRIIFIPNNVVNLIYPPLLLLFTIWQFIVIKKLHQRKPSIDVVFSIISLVAMIASCVLAWIGYTLLAVQIMVWWSFQLACIQTIVCLYDLAKMYYKKYIIQHIVKNETSKLKSKNKKSNEAKLFNKITTLAKKGDYISHTWIYDFFVTVFLPVLAVLSVLVSITFAANMFDMKQLLVKIFLHNFIDQEGLIQISLYKIVLVSALFFVFYYINYLIHSLYRRYKLKQYAKTDATRRPNITLANNIITILVWGSFFIFALVLFKVPKSGISLISAGLATGLGFAMKDILENFIYGLSLMSGRLRVGDYIECDNILGKVESIGYQSTQIVTLDGSIIAFLNTSLFNKNFKNLTKNHSYEYVKLPIGVAYGVNVNEVRTILEEELNKLGETTTASGRPVIQKKQGFKVLFGDFGDNSIDLIVAFWVLVEEKIAFVCKVKETIYNKFQSNNIEIPFPQRDVYIRQVTVPTTETSKKTTIT